MKYGNVKEKCKNLGTEMNSHICTFEFKTIPTVQTDQSH